MAKETEKTEEKVVENMAQKANAMLNGALLQIANVTGQKAEFGVRSIVTFRDATEEEMDEVKEAMEKMTKVTEETKEEEK
jgi:hypothetical protein